MKNMHKMFKPGRVQKLPVLAFCVLCLCLAFCILCLEAVFSNIMFFFNKIKDFEFIFHSSHI